MVAALSQSSTDTMVALQKKQSLLFIRCWLMQALQEGRGMSSALCVLVAAQVHGAHLLAGLVATRLEHSRDGVGIADWAEVLFTGGLWTESEEWLGLYLYLPQCAQMY